MPEARGLLLRRCCQITPDKKYLREELPPRKGIAGRLADTGRKPPRVLRQPPFKDLQVAEGNHRSALLGNPSGQKAEGLKRGPSGGQATEEEAKAP